MIYDSISNAASYFKGNKTWEKIFSFISSVSADTPIGRTEIDGSDVYANVSAYEPVAEADGVFEAHHKYIDIQIILDGCEKIFASDIAGLSVKTEYNSEKDFLLYETPDAPAAELPMKPGYFAMFYPHDAHKPCIRCCGACTTVKKIVVKVNASLLP